MSPDLGSPNESNGSSLDSNVNGTGILEIDGEQFEYRESGDEIEVLIPDDFPEEKRATLDNKVDEFKSTLASAKRKAYEVNRERENLDKERRELEREREQLRRERESAAPTNKQENDLLQHFGVDSWDKVSNLQIEDPEAYHKGIASYNAAISAQSAMAQMQHSVVEKQIVSEGYNPETIKTFAKASGISRIDVAFDYYKRTEEKPKGISLAEIQKKSVKFVPKGSTSSGSNKAPGLASLYKDLD